MPSYGAPTVADLESVSDVHVTTPTDQEALVFNSSSAKWINGRAATIPTQFLPSNPATTTSAVPVMMGLALAYAPKNTSVKIIAQVTMSNATVADGGSFQISHGTGSAPSNGGALAGTQDGKPSTVTSSLAGETDTIMAVAIASGLTVGTPIWIDLAYNVVTGGTLTASNIVVIAE